MDLRLARSSAMYAGLGLPRPARSKLPRHASCGWARRRRLFDCGEARQRQLVLSKSVLLDPRGHLHHALSHADTSSAFPAMLDVQSLRGPRMGRRRSTGRPGRAPPVRGPAARGWQEPRFSHFDPGRASSPNEQPSTATATRSPLRSSDHRVTAYGYALIEGGGPGRFDTSGPSELVVEPGPDVGRPAVAGEEVNGVESEQVVGEPPAGTQCSCSTGTNAPSPLPAPPVAAPRRSACPRGHLSTLGGKAASARPRPRPAPLDPRTTARDWPRTPEVALLSRSPPRVPRYTPGAGACAGRGAFAVFDPTIVPRDFDRVRESPFPRRRGPVHVRRPLLPAPAKAREPSPEPCILTAGPKKAPLIGRWSSGLWSKRPCLTPISDPREMSFRLKHIVTGLLGHAGDLRLGAILLSRLASQGRATPSRPR